MASLIVTINSNNGNTIFIVSYGCILGDAGWISVSSKPEYNL